MLDTLQIIFWSITYILIVIAGFQSKPLRKVSMPYVAGVLNFSWEICALYTSGGFWGHILWLALDLMIVYWGFRYLDSKKQKAVYAASIIFSTFTLFFVFKHPLGMLYSVFIIDLIMAIYYLIDRKALSPKLKVPIAFTKLAGDVFAGFCYAPSSKFVGFLAILVFLCNLYYLYLCLEEQPDSPKKNRNKKHSFR